VKSQIKAQITNRQSQTPTVQPRSRTAWRAWLQKHHAKAPGVWLRFAKKASGLPTVNYNDAVEEALCFGWIDGLMRPVDETFYMQLFTPRKAKSNWAQSNKTRVARLIDEGLMTPAGLAAIEAAKACGSWDTLTAAEALKMPPELRKAINANARAKKHWPEFTESQRKQFLYYLASAKRAETRQKRIGEIVLRAVRKIPPGQGDEARRRQRADTT
jgi:uncharacterized protein YdeI (YjbR/CyaY-like superfamily)